MDSKTEIEHRLVESIKKRENVTKERMEQAEKINFGAVPDKVISTDEFGFIKKDTEHKELTEEEKETKRKEMLKTNARIEKWNVMIEQISAIPNSELLKRSKLKSRTRKGIPDSLRGFIWQTFADVNQYYKADLYKQLCESKDIDEETETVILKDLDRTFPHIYHFKDKYGTGQRSLYRVLSSYSKYNKSTGYVQGMGFISALLLTYMNEEMSFFLLHALMKKKEYNMEGFYLDGFPQLKPTFYVLLSLMKKHLPKIYEAFSKYDMMPSMYASEWFITLFSRELDFKILVRIFDVFLLEGFKIIYRFCLGFLKLKEERFVNAKNGLVGLMTEMKDLFANVDIDELFKVSFGFSISRDFIKKCVNSFSAQKAQFKRKRNI